MIPLLDYVETWNARIMAGDGNARAAEFAKSHGLPGVAASDAHTVMEVGVAYTILTGPIDTADEFRAALALGTRHGHVARLAARSSGYAGGESDPAAARQQAGTGRLNADDEHLVNNSAAVSETEEQIPDYPLVHEEDAPPPPLSSRLRDPRTIVSLIIPLIVIVLVLVAFPTFHLEQLPSLIAQANWWLLLAAFIVYYLGFPLRGYRWAILLKNAGSPIRVRDSTEIIFISWLVNCLVPAKLGDVYRAYLVKVNNGTSASLAFGTIFIERVFDLFAIVLLGLAAGFWSFRSGMSPEVQLIFAIGLVVIIFLAVALFLVRNFGSRLVRRLPLPTRVVDFYDRFEEGLFSIKARNVPVLAILTVLIWMTEAFRLYFVVLAMGFSLPMGLSGGLFVALIASLLTAIPFTPAGLGAVEGASWSS